MHLPNGQVPWWVTTMHVTPRYRGAIIEAVPVHFARLDLPPNPAVEKGVFDRIRWGAGTHFWGTACFKIKGIPNKCTF